MIQIKHRKDLNKIPKNNPAYPILDELCTNLIDNYPQHDPSADGWLVLCERKNNDFTRPLNDIFPEEPTTLLDLKNQWESVTYEKNSFYSPLWLRDNQFGLLFLIPDCPELPDDVRQSLEYHID